MLRVLAIRGRGRDRKKRVYPLAVNSNQFLQLLLEGGGEDVKGAAAQSFAGKLSRHAYPLTEMVKMHGSSSGIN